MIDSCDARFKKFNIARISKGCGFGAGAWVEGADTRTWKSREQIRSLLGARVLRIPRAEECWDTDSLPLAAGQGS